MIIATGPGSSHEERQRLLDQGCEVLVCDASTHAARLDQLLDELGRRRMTNVLVEGGGRLLGTLFDLRAIDEIHVFIAPKLIGGAGALSPLSDKGIERMRNANTRRNGMAAQSATTSMSAD